MRLVRDYDSAMDPAALAPRHGLRAMLRPGPHDAEILRLAIPAFGALVAEPLFLLGDSAIVGRIGTVSLGGLGVASQALTTLVSISIFLAYGTTAAVARQLGAGNRRAAIQLGIDGLWLAGGIGAAVLGAGLLLAPLIVHVFGASPAVTAGAVTYLRISLLGAPAMLTVLAGTGVLRGLQDTRTPLAVAVGASAANIVLNAIFVLGLGWGLAGSAWGTAVVQNAAALTFLAVIARGARRGGAGVAHAVAAGGARGHHRARGADGRRRHRRAPDRVPHLDAAVAGPRRDRDRGAGDHRQVPGRGRRGRGAGRYGQDDRLGRGVRGRVRRGDPGRAAVPARALRGRAAGGWPAAHGPAGRRGAAAGRGRGLRARRGAHRGRGPGLPRAGRACHRGGVRHRGGLRARPARRPGRALACLRRLDRGPVRHPDAARPGIGVVGRRPRPLTAPVAARSPRRRCPLTAPVAVRRETAPVVGSLLFNYRQQTSNHAPW